MQLFGHPLHPAVVHFPIALLGTSLAFDLAGIVRGEELWWTIAFWNVAVGLATAAVAAITGLADALQIEGDPPATRKAIRHLVAVVSAVICYAASLVVRGGSAAPEGITMGWVLAIEVLGLGLLLLGGWLGGELVYGTSEPTPEVEAAPIAAADPPRH
ncbi:MAG TPA: DUF2231 domain-containing protein [Vulgatibacter sp.]|nr:DUF2231 domain-containing protein [Vulgatibacter sp.]